MELLFALLGGWFGNIGPAAAAAEPQLPIRLDLRELDPSPLVLPELDPHWPVFWLVELPEDALPDVPIVFPWPASSPPGDPPAPPRAGRARRPAPPPPPAARKAPGLAPGCPRR